MYYEVEQSGCCEHEGMVQVRFSVYLEPGDYGYSKHNVLVPVIPEGGYPGAVIGGIPQDATHFKNWLESLPTQLVNNPFHNHFVYLEPPVTDPELHVHGKRILKEAMDHWEKDRTPHIKNDPVVFDKNPSESRRNQIANKVNDLKSRKISGRLDV